MRFQRINKRKTIFYVAEKSAIKTNFDKKAS